MNYLKVMVYLMISFFICQTTYVTAQTNYRPHGSKNTDHSYFKNGTIDIVMSSHQDIAWMDSIKACEVFRDEKMITPVLNIMKTNSDFCFDVEDALCLKEYLSRHPDRYDEILKRTQEGRLEWGATYNQPYESMYDGEALIRELYLGKKWLEKKLPGCNFITAWNEDVPGIAMQFPQILSKSGVKYFEISRFEPGIYRWSSPDGSNILAYTPGIYSWSEMNIFNIKTEEGQIQAIINYLNSWNVLFKTNKLNPAIPFLISSDWFQPHEYTDLISKWNKMAGEENLPIMNYSTASSSFQKFDTPISKYDQVVGERPNMWLYIHGPSHEHALTASRKANRTLTAAEKFASINSILQKNSLLYPQNDFTTAWGEAIYPDHGWGGKCGAMTDLTFRNKFESAYKTADKILKQSLFSISQHIGFNKIGKAIVVFNPLSWERTDKVELSVNVYGQDTVSYKIIDAVTGKEVPSQLIKSKPTKKSDEFITLVFVAENVPSIGYKTYYLVPFVGELNEHGVPVKPTNPSAVNAVANSNTYENKFYKIQFGYGGLKSIYDKQLKKELLQTNKLLGGEIFQLESIGNGAGEFTNVQPVSMNGFERVNQYHPQWNCSEYGSVRKSWTFTQQTKYGIINETVTLYDDLKEIDFKTNILGFSGERYREYRMAFPLNQVHSEIAYEVPMGVVQVGKSEMKGSAGYSYKSYDYSIECSKIHPREVQDWFGSSKDNVSVSIESSVAVFDWIDPTDSTDINTVLQPILLASRKSCNSQGNYYLQPGNHSYQFCFTSFKGDWKNNVQKGKQQNQSLIPIVVNVQKRKDGLPESRSFASLNADNIVITTMKKADDDDNYIIRLCEMDGKDTEITIKLPLTIEKAWKTNMIEENEKEIGIHDNNSLTLNIGHNAIETIKLRLKSNTNQ